MPKPRQRNSSPSLKKAKPSTKWCPTQTPEGEAIKAEGPTAVIAGTTNDFSRNSAGYIRGIGVAKDIMAKAFAMKKRRRCGRSLYPGPGNVRCAPQGTHRRDTAKFEEEFEKNAYINQWPPRSASTEQYTAWMREQAAVDTGY